MTAIVGLVHGGRVYLGGDSAGVGSYSIHTRKDPKVFRNGPYVLGFTSSFRMGQVLHHVFKAPHPEGDLYKFMVTKFIDEVRSTLKTAGFATKEKDAEQGGKFLVGVHGRLFRVESDYQVGELAKPYDAVGMGDELALGALHATEGAGLSPKRRLTVALEAAEEFSYGVRGPFTFASTKAQR